LPSRAPLLQAIDVKKQFLVGSSLFKGQRKIVYAVDGVSLEVYPGETLGLVGESGCGKSTLGRCLMRLYEITAGNILLNGADISRLSLRDLRPYRRQMQMVFQDPYASLNPRRRVGDLIAEPLRVHGRGNRSEIEARLRTLMELVGLQQDHLNRFPHEFSGGQRQRIGVARALALEPKLIIADEPVSALDVSIQAQIVNLFADLQERLGLTYIFIAHDLSVVRQVSNRVAVMYLGAIVETGPTEEIFRAPAHPYTEALISAVPVPEIDRPGKRERIVLAGDVPSPMNPPEGCRFHPRCRYATDRCKAERPVLESNGTGRQVACHYPLVGGTAAAAQ
jgi:peptide/nickel transport system ATP-binding protein